MQFRFSYSGTSSHGGFYLCIYALVNCDSLYQLVCLTWGSGFLRGLSSLMDLRRVVDFVSSAFYRQEEVMVLEAPYMLGPKLKVCPPSLCFLLLLCKIFFILAKNAHSVSSYPFLNVSFSSVLYIFTLLSNQYLKHFLSCRTETLYPLNNSLFPLSFSLCQSPFYFISMNLTILVK